MQVKSIDQFIARCEAKGIERDVSLFMMQGEEVEIGDYLMVHVGYAIQKMSEADAQSAWELYDEMLAATEQDPIVTQQMAGNTETSSEG